MNILHTFCNATSRLALLLVVVGLTSPAVAAAQAVVDVSVIWTAPFEEETGVGAVPDATHETVLVNDDDTLLVANGDIEPAPARTEALEAFGADPDSLVPVDAGTSGDPQYWLDLVMVDGTPYGAFTLARGGERGVTMTMFFGTVTTFASGMAQAQAAVLVDGTPVFDGVEPSGLQTALETAVPAQDGGDAGEESDPAATEERPDDNDAFADQPGMIADGEYESPHHGYSLTWTDEWTFDTFYDAPVASDLNADFDEVHLTVDSWLSVYFGFYAFPLAPGVSFAEFMELSSSPERLEVDIDPTAELVVSRIGIDADGQETGALIISVTLEGYDFLVYEEYRAGSGQSVAALQLVMYVGDAEAGLDAADSLEFEGGPVVTVFSDDEIVDAAQATGYLEGYDASGST